MKLIYFHRMLGNYFSSVEKKIYSQVKSLSDLGLNAVFILNCEDDSQFIPDKYMQVEPIPVGKSRFKILNKIKREYSINTRLKNTITSLTSNDILYMRIPYPFLSISRSLKKTRLCKIVIEYQAIEPLEMRLKGKYWYLPMDYLFGDAIRRYSDGIVGVTEEITTYELARSGDPRKPHITIGNGIDVNSIKLRKVPLYPENELHLLCVANVNRWHGIDRLLRGLAEYKGSTNVTVHIAGKGSELIYLSKLSRDLNIEENVVFHGYLTGTLLDELFDKCHIAVGSLALHRKGLTQTSELKAREYCARGIPFILSSADQDFTHDNFPALLTIYPDDCPIDIENILKFAAEMGKDTEHPRKMREYAFEYLDWSVKMITLKEFFASLIRVE